MSLKRIKSYLARVDCSRTRLSGLGDLELY